ncbi:MAG TPA: hypothetical protein VJP85_05645 [Candidatus Baltobacteraceae bacterium]|nr:hypothetical protein [Candidatus Baltobacteraceae bacterium]
MNRKRGVSGWAAPFVDNEDDEDADQAETDRDTDPNTWDIESEFAARSNRAAEDESAPFCARIHDPEPTAFEPRRAPVITTPPQARLSKRQAWRMLFAGLGGLLLDLALIVQAALQVIYALLWIALLVIVLVLLSKCGALPWQH